MTKKAILQKLSQLHRPRSYVITLSATVVALLGISLFTPLISFGGSIESVDQAVLGANTGAPSTLQLDKQQTSQTFTSQSFRSQFAFNAIAPHWKETSATDSNRSMQIRVSDDGRSWSKWLDVEAVKGMRTDDPHPDRTFVEAPIFVSGHYFQYRVTMSRPSISAESPEIKNLKFNYINSEQSQLQKIVKTLQGITSTATASAADQGPNVVSREGWGSPDPYGKKFRGTNKHWAPRYQPVNQVFLHHTATSSYQSDPKAVIRAIWDYHANTLGWGDIGYNYLIDRNGTVYEGRFGGDNVIAGHVYRYNKGSMGVAVLGCFQPNSPTCEAVNDGNTTAPSDASLNSLSTLLSWKTTNYEIDPKNTHTFCDIDGKNCLNLATIAAHRNANDTSCNGQLFYDKLPQIRDATANKNTNSPWAYSAKQASFNTTDLRANSTTSVTMSYKNTGTATWSNSTNKLLLKTANPTGRTSSFKGSDWISDKTLTTLNETSVAPGETGSFSFELKRPSGVHNFRYEGVRLVTEDGTKLRSYFTQTINATCSFGSATNPRPNGLIIRNPSNGKIFLIKNGEKSYIASPLAAKTHNLALKRALNVSSEELNNLTTGASTGLKEGTLIKAKDNPAIYIIDEEGSNRLKRHVTNPETMRTFDLTDAPLHHVKQRVLDNLTTGTNLSPDSPIPDGLLVKSKESPKILLIENGARRWVTSLKVFESYGYNHTDVRKVKQTKIDALNDGTKFNRLRTGTLVTAEDTTKVYSINTDAGANSRRWINNPASLTQAGFKWNDLVTISSGSLGSYNEGDTVVCHK